MKKIRRFVIISAVSTVVLCVSCGKNRGDANGSGSESQVTANDSSGAESKKAMGVGEDNQNKVKGYPSNQSNLNSDSTSRRHDVDTVTKKPQKDRPNRHE